MLMPFFRIAPDGPCEDREVSYLRGDSGHAIEELIANALDWRTKSEQIEAPSLLCIKEIQSGAIEPFGSRRLKLWTAVPPK
jgi:hypothetical protein